MLLEVKTCESGFSAKHISATGSCVKCARNSMTQNPAELLQDVKIAHVGCLLKITSLHKLQSTCRSFSKSASRELLQDDAMVLSSCLLLFGFIVLLFVIPQKYTHSSKMIPRFYPNLFTERLCIYPVVTGHSWCP